MVQGPQFVEFFNPVLSALKELGGSARPSEVEDWIIENVSVSTDLLNAELASGGSRFKNRVHWARFYLAKAKLIDSSVRGVWSLTEKGFSTELQPDEALELFRTIHSRFKVADSEKSLATGKEEEADLLEIPEVLDHKLEALEVLKSLPPDGFERLCQRLLRESGFDNVVVTGRSRDGGIDGHGILRVNPLVSFYVYFQCKRYSSAVGSPIVRDFRGAMVGRADKGIILTTASFSKDARQEATRDGATPIELVDGDTLVQMLENLELGMIPRTVYELDEKFFEEFGYET